MIKKVLKVFLIVILMAVIADLGWNVYQKNSKLTDANLVSRVGKLVVLPDAAATIATVTDATKLNSQIFFKNAQNGDKVLIFSDAGKAILYRPKINKIVEVSSVQPADQTKPSSTNVQLSLSSVEVVDGPMQLVLDNGTPTAGLTTNWEKKITGKFPDIVVKSKDLASRNDYQQTIIIDISGKYKQRLSDLAAFLDAKIVPMPQGENVPDADILVIFGKSSVK